MKNLKTQYLLLILGFIALPFLVEAIPMLGATWVRILGFAMLYVLLALGLNIVIGYAGLLDMGYIASTPLVPTCMHCWLRPTCKWPACLRLCWTGRCG